MNAKARWSCGCGAPVSCLWTICMRHSKSCCRTLVAPVCTIRWCVTAVVVCRLAGFKNRWGTKTKSIHPFEAKCREQGIEHRKTRPYMPKTGRPLGRSMVERANGLTKENTTKRNCYTSVQQMKDDLARWHSFYNFDRRNRRIGRKTPYQMACWWFEKQPELFLKEPSHLLQYRSQPGET